MIDFFLEYSYVGLFFACFLAATILPIASEIVFTTLILSGLDVWICILVGGTGNWLGGLTNYYIGFLGKTEWAEKYLKIKEKDINKAKSWVYKKGAGIAFFAFLPIIGDLIALVLGFLRANFYIVATTMFLGKTLRYILLAYGIMYGIDWVK